MSFQELLMFLIDFKSQMKKRKIRECRSLFFKIELPLPLLEEAWEFIFTEDKIRLYNYYRIFQYNEKTKICNIFKYML